MSQRQKREGTKKTKLQIRLAVETILCSAQQLKCNQDSQSPSPHLNLRVWVLAYVCFFKKFSSVSLQKKIC